MGKEISLTAKHERADKDVAAVEGTKMNDEVATQIAQMVQETYVEYNKAGVTDNVPRDFNDYLSRLNGGLREKLRLPYDCVTVIDKGEKGLDSADQVRVWIPKWGPDGKVDLPLCPPQPEVRHYPTIFDYKNNSGLYN